MSVKITDKPTVTSMSTADKIFANIGGTLKQITKEMFLKDTHDKIDQVNSNLSNLKVSDVAGGKNLWCLDSSYTTTVNESAFIKAKNPLKAGTYRLSYNTSTSLEFIFYTDDPAESTAVHATANNAFTLSKDTKYVYLWINTGTVSNIQIEEGSQATDYEPYIPSVKMIAEENVQQSTEMMDIKMLGWSVPKECPIQNEVNGNQFVQKVGRVDLGSLEWLKEDASSYIRFQANAQNCDLTFSVRNGKCYLFGYEAKYNNEAMETGWNKVVYTGKDTIYIQDTSYTDATTFKQAMQGQYLYYELATPITMSIDSNEKAEQIEDSLSALGKCKNLLKPTLQTTTQNGVTCTNNGDGTYTLNGTESGTDDYLQFVLKTFKLPKGSYLLFGNPTEPLASTRNFAGILDVTTGYQVGDLSYNKKAAFIEADTDKDVQLIIRIFKGSTLNNEVFKPMLTTNLNATYDDFVPYTGDGDTLTADVAKLNSDLSDLIARVTALEGK